MFMNPCSVRGRREEALVQGDLGQECCSCRFGVLVSGSCSPGHPFVPAMVLFDTYTHVSVVS